MVEGTRRGGSGRVWPCVTVQLTERVLTVRHWARNFCGPVSVGDDTHYGRKLLDCRSNFDKEGWEKSCGIMEALARIPSGDFFQLLHVPSAACRTPESDAS